MVLEYPLQLSAHSKLLDKAQDQLYAACFLSALNYKRDSVRKGQLHAGLFSQSCKRVRQDPWPLDSYSPTPRGTHGLLSYLGLAPLPALSPTWLAICWVLTGCALQELLLTEEEAANQRELDREKDSVAYLSQARADIEGTNPLSEPSGQ